MATNQPAESCDYCRIGHTQPTTAPYIYWINRQVLVLPNAPAYLCDICGQLQFDAGFLSSMDILIQEMEQGMPFKEPVRKQLLGKRPSSLQSTESR